METNTAILLEKLAVKLGTTIEHLWGILTKQAMISGITDTIIGTTLIILIIYLYKFIKNKTSVTDDRYSAEWSDLDGVVVAWLSYVIFLCVSGIVIICCIENTITAFANPEYWALNKILSSLK